MTKPPLFSTLKMKKALSSSELPRVCDFLGATEKFLHFINCMAFCKACCSVTFSAFAAKTEMTIPNKDSNNLFISQLFSVNMPTKVYKNPETTKHFGIFNINKVWRLLYHDHLSIIDIDTLTRLSDTLALEGVVSVIGLN